MSIFSSSTPFDQDVERATSENNTSEDWGLILDICEKIQKTSNGPKDGLKSIIKRMNHRIPNVSMQAVVLLDACISNCGRQFHQEIASRSFVDDCKSLIKKKLHPKVVLKLKFFIKKWAEGDFKSDPSLSLIPKLYSNLKDDGHEFVDPDTMPSVTQTISKDPNVVNTQQEENDIAKAIELSLKESEPKTSTNKNYSQSLYPTVYSSPSKIIPRRTVRALYDFEAVEDNELTFKTGDLIEVTDDTDTNWWEGCIGSSKGLFPANFVTADLNAVVEKEEKKSVQFNEEVEVKVLEPVTSIVEIDSSKIDQVLEMLQNADPTAENVHDQAEMKPLEEHCKSMGILIDKELEKIDGEHAGLIEVNNKLKDALSMYHSLMGGIQQSNMPVQSGIIPIVSSNFSLPSVPSSGLHSNNATYPLDSVNTPQNLFLPPTLNGSGVTTSNTQVYPPASSINQYPVSETSQVRYESPVQINGQLPINQPSNSHIYSSVPPAPLPSTHLT